MESYRKQLKAFGWIYFVLAILSLLVGVGVFFLPESFNKTIVDAYNSVNFQGLNPKTILGVSVIVEAALYFIYFLLIKSVATGKSKVKNTILMVLLILSIVGSIIALVGSFSIIEVISLLIDAYVLYLVVKIR